MYQDVDLRGCSLDFHQIGCYPLWMLDLNQPWKNSTIVAFDTETSGAYPLGSEIVEFGAVKWKNGHEVARYQILLKPSVPMGDFIIGIHGITNEMVADAPKMPDKIQEIANFLKGSFLVAHHAPFDLGFLAVDLEKNNIAFPEEPALCSSLLARKLVPESRDHKLQTLVKLFNINGGQAHRACDDAFACLQVTLECMKRLGEDKTVGEVIKAVGKDLRWPLYSILKCGNEKILKVAGAIERKKPVDIIYAGGSKRDETRRISPIGIVRNPDGDYVMALCHRDGTQKRFYFEKIKDLEVAL